MFHYLLRCILVGVMAAQGSVFRPLSAELFSCERIDFINKLYTTWKAGRKRCRKRLAETLPRAIGQV